MKKIVRSAAVVLLIVFVVGQCYRIAGGGVKTAPLSEKQKQDRENMIIEEYYAGNRSDYILNEYRALMLRPGK